MKLRSVYKPKIWLFIGGIFFLIYLIFNMMSFYNLYKPAPTSICCTTPIKAYQNISFESENLTLSGWYIPPENGVVVIMLHGYGGNRTRILPVANMLSEAGYGVLLYDMRGHGESDGRWRSFGWQDVTDVENAIFYLQGLDEVTKIAIWGYSAGGQVAIRAAAQLNSLGAVIADAPAIATAQDYQAAYGKNLNFYHASFRDLLASWLFSMDIPRSVTKSLSMISPRPILLIRGEDDKRIVPAQIEAFYDSANEPKALWIVPHAGHGSTWQADPEAYATRIISFLNDALDVE